MHKSKKGFTIVELVIVIAVIAILAAVLIPTFSNLVKKANIAADTQLAKNLNTALTMAEAKGDKVDTFNDALKALRDGGYIISNLNPTAEGCYFVWEAESNQILLVDGEKNYSVIYKSKELSKDQPGATWHFAVSNIDDVDGLKALGGDNNHPSVVYSPKNAEALEGAFEDVYTNGGTVVISQDITMGSGNFLLQPTVDDSANATIDLAGNTMTNTSNIDYTVTGLETSKRFGQLTAANGTLTIANGNVASHSGSSFVISAIESGKVIVEDVVIDSFAAPTNGQGAGVALRVLGAEADMKVSDTTVNLKAKGGGCEIGIGTATFENVNIVVDSTNDSFSNMCVSASRDGTLTINSGNYTAKGSADGVIALYTTAGNIVINGGTFTAQTTTNAICNPYLPTNNAYTLQHTIILKGGTFVFGNKTVTISALTDANYQSEIKSLFGTKNCADIANHITVAKIDGGYKVTID